jgi:glycosyltransferase involved in cell wall biosynthesis
MKVLLISDIPPCDDFTAGIVLSAMVRFLPRGSICCFAVVNPLISVRMSSEFSGIPVEFHRKPMENWAWLPDGFPVSRISSLASRAGETAVSNGQVKSLIAKAIAFGRAQRVDRVWTVMQGQTTIRMALAVADGLNVPLHTQVWDPFSWWAKANQLDDRTARQTQDLFDETIRRSAAVATASHPMARLYRDRFGVKAVPVISSYPRAIACTPVAGPRAGEPIVIGMAGQFYAADEWSQLLAVLHAVDWTVAGCRVSIVAMGPMRPPSKTAEKVTFLGWKPQKEAIEILAGCDFLYCPYPFDPSMEEVARQSFPSKLVLYLASGRLVIFHGPAYSSAADYIAGKGCGVLATNLSAESILREIERLVGDRELYADMASKAQAAFLEDFTLESMARSFADFIGLQADGVTALYDHTRRDGETIQPDQLPPSMRRSLLSFAVRHARMARQRSKKTRAGRV